jgi:hypothetical protein
MEHSLHLGVGHLLSRITPVQTGRKHNTENGNEDDVIEVMLAGEDNISSALYKLLELIKQVHVIHRRHYHIY